VAQLYPTNSCIAPFDEETMHLIEYADNEIDSFHVSTDADTLEPGDTTRITIIAIDSTGQETWADSTMLLRISALPDTLGTLIGANGLPATAPLTNVRYADAREGRIRFAANTTPPPSTTTVAIQAEQSADPTKSGAKTLFVSGRIDTILLGETKYFKAVNDEQGNLTIKVYQSRPPEGSLSNVEWTVTRVEGGRLGVYYEYRDSTGAMLSGSDRIRVIGRYWALDTTYRVQLRASQGGRLDSIVIRVERPDSLGRLHTITRDVFDNIVNVDSICIVNAGRFGIPPQLIKGQMREEAPPRNMEGITGFTPAYRYEVLTEQVRIQSDPRWIRNQAFVSDSAMGTVPVPNHQHVRDIPYPTIAHKAWWYLEQHSDLVRPSPQLRMYARREEDGRMNFEAYGGRTVQRVYDGFLHEEIQRTPQSEQAAIERARQRMIVHLRDRWQGGLNNFWAQTRLASSYGLLQVLFSTAVDRGYPENLSNRAPELLNENPIFFPFAMAHQQWLLLQVLGVNSGLEGEWPQGFETTFLQVINGWNPWRPGYEERTLQYSMNYLPFHN
jgi:hypothetical protein